MAAAFDVVGILGVFFFAFWAFLSWNDNGRKK